MQTENGYVEIFDETFEPEVSEDEEGDPTDAYDYEEWRDMEDCWVVSYLI